MAKKEVELISERLLKDLKQISMVQNSVILQKKFATARDKGFTISKTLDYMSDDDFVPVKDVKALMTILRLKEGKDIDIEFDGEFINIIDGKKKSVMRYSEETLVPYIKEIEDKSLFKSFEKGDEFIKINISKEEFMKMKKSAGIFSDAMYSFKKYGDEIKVFIMSEENIESCIHEVIDIPIETDNLEEFSMTLLSRDTFLALEPDDYSIYIIGFAGGFRVVMESDVSSYGCAEYEPITQGFDIDELDGFIDVLMGKTKKAKKKKKGKKKVVEDEIFDEEDMEEEEKPKKKKAKKKKSKKVVEVEEDEEESEEVDNLNDLDIDDDDDDWSEFE